MAGERVTSIAAADAAAAADASDAAASDAAAEGDAAVATAADGAEADVLAASCCSCYLPSSFSTWWAGNTVYQA